MFFDWYEWCYAKFHEAIQELTFIFTKFVYSH